MKIKAKNPNAVANSRLIVPFDGLISIDGEGIADVSKECAKNLVECTSDWEYADEVVEESEEEEQELSEREKFEKELQGMTVPQLKDFCRQGELPEEEWRSLKKATLIAYLMDKFDKASEKEEEEDITESEEEISESEAPVESEEEEDLEEEELEEEEKDNTEE